MFDVSSTAGLNDLNKHLETRSYVEGYGPTQTDATLFSSIKSKPAEKADQINLFRWHKHIASFSDAERKAWAAGSTKVAAPAAAPAKAPAKDDDFDLFEDEEEESEEARRIKEERVRAYEEKKAKKPALIAKSNVILDVKPWDDETDMKEMERLVRTIEMEGLLWGTSKLVPLAFGIKKLTISCVVEDDKVSVDDLEEKITSFEDYVQSVDIAAFQKI